ncbi:MAG TPA: inositol 2-dehydrogenase, partial [Chroococcales cyanobacterium]
VVIASSTDTHARIIEEAAKEGKHIFCEKPIDQELSKIDRALDAVKKAGVKLQIGFNRRYDPNFLHIKRAVENGQVGDLRIIKITSRDPGPPPIEYVKVSGGMFMDMTIHDFDMARYIAGKETEVESVFAVGGVQVDKAIGDAGDIDTAVITLQFSNGTVCVIDNCRQAAYGYDQRLEVFGSLGCIAAENETSHRVTLMNKSGCHSGVPLDFFMTRYLDSYLAEMCEFVDCLAQDRPPETTGEDGRVPVLMAMAASRSLKEKRIVSLAEVADRIPQ